MSEQVKSLSMLPKGWILAYIKDLCNLINGRAFKSEEWSSEGLPIIRIQNLNDPQATFNYCNFNVEDKYIVDSGQLLFAWSGTPGTSFGAHIWNSGKGVLNQHIFKVGLCGANIDKRYLKYAINYNISQYINKAHGTAGLAHITKSKFDNSLIPLPPLNEQHRIVTRIEELFSHLDAGVEALQKAKAQLRRYRQAVLKAAVEGKLTEEWRKVNKTKQEPSSISLHYSNVDLDTDKLQRLPDFWYWSTLGQCFDIKRGRFSIRPRNDPRYYNGPYPFVQIGDLPPEGGKIVRFTQTLNEEGLRISRMFPKGTVLIAIVGATIANTGVLTFDSCCPDSLVGFQSQNGVSLLFLEYYLRYKKHEIRNTSYSSGGQPNINLKVLYPYPIPIPPLTEQYAIIKEVEYILANADEVENSIKRSTGYIQRLRQSILKLAFEGKLVPQDPNDEPASILLDRIKYERAIHAPKRGRRTNPKTTHQMRLTQ